MKLTNFRRNAGAVTAVLALSISLAACSEDDEPNKSSDDNSSAAENSGEPSADAAGAEAQTFGEGCAAVPKTGDGSFDGMVKDPVATAAGNNDILSTLVDAVTAAGLGDTLNSAEAITVFAPFNGAFDAVPAADLKGLIDGAKKDGANSPLGQILQHHVVAEKNDPTAVVGEQTTLVGDTLTIEGDESGMTVSDGKVTANVICGNIPTANATVYVIDQVLTNVK